MDNLNFSCSLRPILVILRVLGVDLSNDSKEQGSKINFGLKGCYSLILFLFNVTAQVACFILLVFNLVGFNGNTEKNNKVEETFIFTLNMLIDYLNFGLFCILCNLLLLKSVRQRWNSLIESLHLFENQLEPQFFMKLRKISLLGAILIISLVLINLIYSCH